VHAELITGGRSNLTYALDAGDHAWVLRRPPLGHAPATAHDMVREHTVVTALAATPVPVPRTVALCTDPTVLGAPFYLMERVDGVVLRTRSDIGRLEQAERRTVGFAMMDVLADLHGVDPVAVGLESFGTPEGFLARQVRRWGQQFDRSRSRPLPGIDMLRVRLAGSVPPPSPSARRSAVIHGDYRLDNIVLDAQTLEIAAVLDWEMSTLGDPLADLGLLVAYCGGLGAARSPLTQAVGPPAGFPASDELVARYAERAKLGDADLTALGWTTALGFFTIAVVLEGIHYRSTKVRTAEAGVDHVGDVVPALVAAGLAALDAYDAERESRS
jgi:aminoglycoside phosphotransferase (APT) family kinase protein